MSRSKNYLQLIGFSHLPQKGILDDISDKDILKSAHFITPQGVEYHRGEAITKVLRLIIHPYFIFILDFPFFRGFREIGYSLFASQRSNISRIFHFLFNKDFFAESVFSEFFITFIIASIFSTATEIPIKM